MNRERDLGWFINRFAGKDALEDVGFDFVKMDEEGRTRFLTELAEELEIDPKTIDITALAQIESGNFQEFIEKALKKIEPEPRIKLPDPREGL